MLAISADPLFDVTFIWCTSAYLFNQLTNINMFRALAVLASIVGASAFAPARSVARSSALKMNFEDALGAQAPLGFWDPLGLLKDADQERFDQIGRAHV